MKTLLTLGFHLCRVPPERSFCQCTHPPNQQAEPLSHLIQIQPFRAIPAPQSLFEQKQQPKLAPFLSLKEGDRREIVVPLLV